MQYDCLKYFGILINWFGKTYYYFVMIFKNMANDHLVNCHFFVNLRMGIWGWCVTGSGPYILRRSLDNLISVTSFALKTDFTIHQRSHSSMNLYPWNPCGSCIIKKLILSITREHTICNHCDKNYIPKLGLNKKLRIHIVENS